jgi:hypothetical protein
VAGVCLQISERREVEHQMCIEDEPDFPPNEARELSAQDIDVAGEQSAYDLIEPPVDGLGVFNFMWAKMNVPPPCTSSDGHSKVFIQIESGSILDTQRQKEKAG